MGIDNDLYAFDAAEIDSGKACERKSNDHGPRDRDRLSGRLGGTEIIHKGYRYRVTTRPH